MQKLTWINLSSHSLLFSILDTQNWVSVRKGTGETFVEEVEKQRNKVNLIELILKPWLGKKNFGRIL